MRVFITGATSGIGRAVAIACIEAGYEVIASGRRVERLRELREECNTERLIPYELDVTDRDAIQALPGNLGIIDAIINNAGGALGMEPAHRALYDDWHQMIMTNVLGVVSVTHTLLPQLVAERHGTIINLGSIAGEFPYPGGNVYGATKAFVRQFSLNLRADLVGTGVRVTDIEPGLVGDTEFSLVRFNGDHEQANAVYQGMKPLTSADIAGAILWVLNLPSHVCVPTMTLMPTDQGFGPFAISRHNL
ncbi:MAG: SDR family NAD(P)-dependent oxidoreductase [Ferrimicrobium sp.]